VTRQPAQQPSKGSGCSAAKVLIVLGLVFLIGGVALAGTCAWCLATNPEVRKAGALLGETMRMGVAAASAPGADELREAGCEEAMVLDMRRVTKLTEELADELDDDAKVQVPEEPWQQLVVVCQYRLGKPELTCEDVARTYGQAVPNAPEQFGAVVQAGFSGKNVCQGVYGPDGRLVMPLEAEQTP